MMKHTIIEAIRRIQGQNGTKIADWRLVGVNVARQERYYVGEKTEQARAVDEQQYSLTVYVDGEENGTKRRGEATVTIQPSQEPAEIEAKIRQAVFAASKSKNPWFDLPGPAAPKTAIPASGFDALPERERMEKARAALYAPEHAAGPVAEVAGTRKPRINSLELFLSREERSFVNSKGQEFIAKKWRGYSEFVVEAGSPDGMVELFDDVEFSDPDSGRLGAATGARLTQVADRAVAVKLPSLKDIPVILSGKEAEDVFGWFFGNSSTSAVFTKASTFAQGANVQAADSGAAVAEPLDIWAEPAIRGLPASSAFDADGFPLERTPVIERGVLKTLVGPVRYADWLGVPRKGAFQLFSVSPGATPLADLRASPHLEPVMFSDFRLDAVTGDFGAEIRLAYWFDGKKRVPVTSGSISGSVAELRATMLRSRETAVATRSLCPVAVLLRGVSVTGSN